MNSWPLFVRNIIPLNYMARPTNIPAPIRMEILSSVCFFPAFSSSALALGFVLSCARTSSFDCIFALSSSTSFLFASSYAFSYVGLFTCSPCGVLNAGTRTSLGFSVRHGVQELAIDDMCLAETFAAKTLSINLLSSREKLTEETRVWYGL
jgi:hypothetical protein